MANKKSSVSKRLEEDAIPETDVSKDFLNFLTDELKDIYWSENNLAKALPKLLKVATAEALKTALADHLLNTRLHSERLEHIFEILGEPAKAKKSEAMAGLLEEMTMVLENTDKGSNLRDAGIVLAALKITHHEIATYGGLVQLARTMGNEDIISLLEETLSEEQVAVETLNALTEASLVKSAQGEDDSLKYPAGIENAEAVYDSINLTGKIKKQ